MSAMRFKTSNPDRWIQPRPHRDASLRYMMHGPIVPMEQPRTRFLSLFGWR